MTYSYKLARNVKIGDVVLKKLTMSIHDEYHAEIETDFIGVAPIFVTEISTSNDCIRFRDSASDRILDARPDERVRIFKNA
jgi:hypothetical protein